MTTRRIGVLLACSVLAGLMGLAVPASATAQEPVQGSAQESVPGFDISESQPDVDFAAAYDAGARFAYVQASAGINYTNPHFYDQIRGVKAGGLLRGAYHFARPDRSGGSEQADHLHESGGKWYSDGRTLPTAVDMEDSSAAQPCYGYSHAAMVQWIRDFSDRTEALSGHAPIIYTTASWWHRCTGDSSAFADTNLLWLAHYGDTPGEVPGGWGQESFWQSATRGALPGDQDVFQGSIDELANLTIE